MHRAVCPCSPRDKHSALQNAKTRDRVCIRCCCFTCVGLCHLHVQLSPSVRSMIVFVVP